MSIQSEITLLNNTKEAIKDAIKSKGVMVASTDPFAIYPTRIGQISSTPGDKENLFKALVERTYTTLEVPYGTEVIRKSCFYDNDVVTSITLPETLKSIKNEAFYSCGNLTSITIPANVTYIGEKAFQYCTSLTSITCLGTVPATLAGTSIYVFDNTNNCPIYVPAASVDAYKAAWTKYASRIVGISPYATFNSIVDRSISGDYTIPSDVTVIGSSAFYGCTSLTSVTIHSGVTSIGNLAFYNCTGLTSVTVLATTPPNLNGANHFNNTNNCPIYVPAASVETYKAASVWSTYASRITAIP